MVHAWRTLDRAETPDGRLELRRRDDAFLITLDGRVLMNSHANRSEVALATLGLEDAASSAAPRVLIGGLGMGCSLRAALDCLPPDARVLVSEKNPIIAHWCGEDLASVNAGALADRRVEVAIEDVADRIASSQCAFDAILLDLYEGPHDHADSISDPFYGRDALRRSSAALVAGGTLAVWCEDRNPRFEARLRQAGFSVAARRPGRGGRRHAVVVARREA